MLQVVVSSFKPISHSDVHFRNNQFNAINIQFKSKNPAYHVLFSVSKHRPLMSHWYKHWWHSGTQTDQVYHNGGHKLSSSFLLQPSSIPPQFLGSCQQAVQSALILRKKGFLLLRSVKYINKIFTEFLVLINLKTEYVYSSV